MPRKTNGSTIRVIREALGIKQNELAVRAGIKPGSLSEIETGKVQPRIATTRRIADELGVSLDAITYPVADPAPVTAPA